MANFSTPETFFVPEWTTDLEMQTTTKHWYDIFFFVLPLIFDEHPGPEKYLSLEFSLYTILNSWSFRIPLLPPEI